MSVASSFDCTFSMFSPPFPSRNQSFHANLFFCCKFSRSKSISGFRSTEDQGKITGSDEYLSRIVRPEQDPNKFPNDSVLKEEVVVIRYGECMKNHAANIGRHAVDGSREFMASGEEGTSAALKCAACNCDRSFGRWSAMASTIARPILLLGDNCAI